MIQAEARDIAFIGLGVMGGPMCRNLLKAGYKLHVFDIRKEALLQARDAGATICSSPADAARRAEIIFTMLPDSPHVKEVILGKEGVCEGVRAGSLVVDMSSIAPATAIEISETLAEQKVGMLDAPVSGGEPKAIDGSLAIMVGGPAEALEQARPLLEIMGGSLTHLGPIGSGNICKLANQIMVAVHLAAMSEAMVFAEKAGVDAEKVYEAIRGGLAGSKVLDAKMPLILDRNFKPGGPIRMHTKDLLNVRDTAFEHDAPIPLTAQVMEFMKALKADGKAEDDHASLIRYHEKLAGLKVKRKKD